jgi:hypothetical protein
LLIYTGFY